MKLIKRLIACLFVFLLAVSVHAASLLTEGFEQGTWTAPNDFSSGLEPSGDAAGVGTPCSTYCVDRQTGTVRTGTYAARMCNDGSSDGWLQSTLTDLGITSQDGMEIYIKYYQYIPSGVGYFGSMSSTGNKQIRFGAGIGNGYPVIDYCNTAMCGTCSSSSQAQAWGGFTYYSGGSCAAIQSNGNIIRSGCTSIPTDEWIKIEIYGKYASSSSGGFWWKINDVVFAGSETLNCTTWPLGHSIENLRFAGGNGMPSTGYFYVDDVEIHDSIPAAGSDTTPPVFSGVSPADGATGVPDSTDIVFTLSDGGDGVDLSTVVMVEEGNKHCPTGQTCTDGTAGITYTGTSASYEFTYNPGTDYSYSQEVNVTVDASDGTNAMTQESYSFTTQADPGTSGGIGVLSGAGGIGAVSGSGGVSVSP